ncbi:tRNA pseudouridine(38-40) synthase TruA [Pisciglobus halotolerans]|uniref:tRNA pseudouridine synthase A n=1 Tax=Pisciglobus halotolerans TaxID=745365 RepID=A0A1I3B8S2_9LACT|nr:tRNA pseudouridine(38-40) synthase TruA [Pisciglobus halotolerans]SFH58359.1 tRNA pseudouridine38-40 synthase [Pisciglobus halotolerans]
MTYRYKAKLQYDGTNFAGYQVQPNARTVQGDLEKALRIMSKGHKITIRSAGRTDAGVHALGQMIHFDYPFHIPPQNMLRALNSLTTDEIAILDILEADEQFHAQYGSAGKKYQYRVDTNQIISPFKRLYALHHPYPIHLEDLETALKDIVGQHDFSSFCASRSGKENKVRTVYEAKVEQDLKTGELVFTFRGNGFLYNMVRIFVGTLLQIANGLRPADDMKRILAAKDRNAAGPTAQPQGLYLVEVYYDKAAAVKGTIFEEQLKEKTI